MLHLHCLFFPAAFTASILSPPAFFDANDRKVTANISIRPKKSMCRIMCAETDFCLASQVAQVLAGAALPGELADWEKKWLENLGISSTGCNLKLARSDPMFDWRLVAAARVLCASSEQDLQGLDIQQLGHLDTSLQPETEV